MKPAAGLWIDNRKAIIVTLSDTGGSTQRLLSHVEKQLVRFNRKRQATPIGSRKNTVDERQRREVEKDPDGFFGKVLSCLRTMDSLLVIGPGAAKDELIQLMKQSNHQDRVVVIESADTMTERHIAAKVRHCFQTGS